MDSAKVTISIDEVLLRQIDSLVRERVFSNRGHAIRTAVQEGIVRIDPDLRSKRRTKTRAVLPKEFAETGDRRKWPEF